MTAKEKLRERLDGMSEARAAQTLGWIEDTEDDPLLQVLANAPLDDEPETDEERRLVEEGREDFRRGDVVSWEEIRKEFG